MTGRVILRPQAEESKKDPSLTLRMTEKLVCSNESGEPNGVTIITRVEVS